MTATGERLVRIIVQHVVDEVLETIKTRDVLGLTTDVFDVGDLANVFIDIAFCDTYNMVKYQQIARDNHNAIISGVMDAREAEREKNCG